MPDRGPLGVAHALVPNVYVQAQFVSGSEAKNTTRAIFVQGVLAEPFNQLKILNINVPLTSQDIIGLWIDSII